jgi:hypothetical protein
VLVAFRLNHEDWLFSTVTAHSTHQFISNATLGLNRSSEVRVFELRVTNWAYGVQTEHVHLAAANKLVALPAYGRRIEIIGDSLTAGQYNRYEALSSWRGESVRD